MTPHLRKPKTGEGPGTRNEQFHRDFTERARSFWLAGVRPGLRRLVNVGIPRLWPMVDLLSSLAGIAVRLRGSLTPSIFLISPMALTPTSMTTTSDDPAPNYGFAAWAHRLRCAAAIRALPSAVLGPVERPPWSLHRRFAASTLTRQRGCPCGSWHRSEAGPCAGAVTCHRQARARPCACNWRQ